VYLVPVNLGGGGGGGRGGRGAVAPADGPPRRSALNRHFTMANLAGYPALNVVNGFTDAGTPSSICFYGRPFADGEILALAKSYQDAAQFHLKHPS
jgi:Asp-tRNA(Asn)/Glu-tRNA(Gln) amidotransferase A subunit family amidase